MNKKSTKICSVEGCSDRCWARGLCCAHYFQYRSEKKKSGEWVNIPKKKNRICSVKGCGKKHLAGGMCQMHYTQVIKRENREFILTRYFPNGVVCGKCKKTYDLIQIDAHHLDPDKKEHILSVLLNNSALQQRPCLIAELDECEFLCTRCHQNLHHDPATTHEATYLRKDKGRKIDRMKQMIRQLFGERCQSCEDWLYPKEMEFHHKNPDEKIDAVSEMIRFASQDKVIEEVKKCEILCRNCHRLRLEKVA